jgi:type IV pilus assembly protein PilM
MPRTIGLDIGTFAVRAAEMNVGSGVPSLLRFGQVALPPGAVRDGEIIDTEAVGAAIRRLWREGGFRAKGVVLGVAGQRVIVRPADLPLMSEGDLASALQFEAQELIPIPVEEAILDFQILDQITGVDGDPRMRILLAAAHREMVRTHLAATERGGLDPSAIDPVSFALVRSLAPLATTDGDGAVEAIVGVGAGLTNVVVHERGVPRFTRTNPGVGGDAITEAIARELDVDLDTAEDLKRRVGRGAPDAQTGAAARVVAERLTSIIEDIRNSLEFYQAQPDALPLRRVLITGGGSRTAGLLERLQQQLFVPVEIAHPLQAIDVADVGLTDEQLNDAEPLLAVPIGLALGGGPVPRGTRRISLLPPEIMQGREQRRQAVLVGSAVGAFAVLLIFLWLLQGSKLKTEQRRAADAEANAAALQRQVDALKDVTALDTQIAAKTLLVQSALKGDVAWTRLLNEVATVMPGDVWLTSFGGTKVGVTFAVSGFDHTSTARWILRMNTLRSITGLWVPASTKTSSGSSSSVSFTSSATLTAAAESGRAAQVIASAA